MSRLFDDASSDIAIYTGTVISTEPITMACWFYSDDAAAVQTLISLGDGGANLGLWRLYADGGQANDAIRAQKRDDAGAAIGTTATATGYTVNKWHHAVARFTNASLRESFIDGVKSNANTTTVSDPTPDIVSIGATKKSGAATDFMSGRIEMVGLWNVALSQADISALASGVPPAWVQGANLIHYWKLLGNDSPELDLIGSADLTLTGTAKAADPDYATDWRRILTHPGMAGGMRG
jgi:hypothetical protein